MDKRDIYSEKIFISTDTNDADKLELQALKALVRDNIRDGNGTLLPIGTIDGTGTPPVSIIKGINCPMLKLID